MKKITILLLCAIFSAFCLSGCKEKKQEKPKTEMSDKEKMAAIETFKTKAMESLASGDADFLNNAVDTVALKTLVAKKTSALEIGAGMEIFHGNCRYGDYLLSVDQTGGSVRFDTCYTKNGRYHLVLRTYDDRGSIMFDDLLLNFKKGKVVIEDAFLYSISALLSDKIASEVTLNTFMTIDNPTEDARNMILVTALCQSGQYSRMWELMQDKKAQLLQFTDFYKFYPIGLYECSRNFVADLENLRNDGADERFILYHKLCYFIGQADTDNAFLTITQLINHTGDDPIFWVLYAQTLATAKNYKDALIAYNTAKQGMGYIWDIWTGELACYKRLHETETFQSCLNAGKELFGLTQEECEKIGDKM